MKRRLSVDDEIAETEARIAEHKQAITALRRKLTSVKKAIPVDDDMLAILPAPFLKAYTRMKPAERTLVRASALSLAPTGLLSKAMDFRLEDGEVTWKFRQYMDYYWYVTPGTPTTSRWLKDKESGYSWHVHADTYQSATTLDAFLNAHKDTVEWILAH